MHKINGEYRDGNCSVWLEGGEPYLILNLESYYRFKSPGGRHCDFVYVLCRGDRIEIFIVELKELNEAAKDNIRESIQGKFSQTFEVVKKQILPFLGIKNINAKYHAVLALPGDTIWKIGALTKRDKLLKPLLGEFKKFQGAWITACGENLRTPLIKLK